MGSGKGSRSSAGDTVTLNVPKSDPPELVAVTVTGESVRTVVAPMEITPVMGSISASVPLME